MKLAILGTGKVVDEVLPVLKEVSGIELSAILPTPRGPEKAQELAEIYDISQANSDYDSVLVNPDVDTVYVALLGRLYYDYAEEALLAGKHVVYEKPFTLALAEFRDLAGVVEQNSRILSEAVTNQYLSSFAATKGNLAELDDIEIVECNYSQYSSCYDAFKRGEIAPAFNPGKGDGALCGLNIYNAYLVIGLFGEPKKAQCLVNMERGVDISGIPIMNYGYLKAARTGAKDCATEIKPTIQGNKGSITVIGATNTLPELALSLNNQSMTMINENTLNHRMHDKSVTFQAITKRENMTATKLALEHSHAVMEVLDAAVNSL